jgi:lipoyl(octanoyl) transferase
LAPVPGSAPVEWHVREGLLGYADAVAVMEARALAIAAGDAHERVWLIEHQRQRFRTDRGAFSRL